MPSCMASSFSQGDAFISSKPERTTTLTSSPPRRRAVRQQSIAVLPPPSTTTRLPMRSMWPNETFASQSMPMWMLAAPPAGRERRGRARAARRCRRTPRRTPGRAASAGCRCARRSGSRSRRCRRCSRPPRRSPPRAGGTRGIWLRIMPPPFASPSNSTIVVAERREVARDGERGRAGADQRDTLAVCARPALSAGQGGCRPCCRRRRASGGRSRRAPPRRARGGRPARTAGRRCGRGCPGRRWTSN